MALGDAIWWAKEGELAGMPMPFLAPARRERMTARLRECDDELPELWDMGIRSVACLLGMRGDRYVYQAAGFQFLCLPIPNGGCPDPKSLETFLKFYHHAPKAIAVHCEAGLGRTGTMIATALISDGWDPTEAIAQVRNAQPAAIETKRQVEFLNSLAEEF